MSYQLLLGDCLDVMRGLPSGSVQTCVTSPPYYGLRDYGHDDQIGLEDTPDAYVAKLVDVFREVKRVLHSTGTCWINIGDSYNGSGKGPTGHNGIGNQEDRQGFHSVVTKIDGLKPKDLIGIPWLVAFALRADGWYLRSDIIWHKPNPMPESVTDRPTKAHEYIFLLSKSREYFYDADAIKEPSTYAGQTNSFGNKSAGSRNVANLTGNMADGVGYMCPGTRNKRSVWTVTTKPYAEAHFAVFPMDLIEPCILAGSKAGDTVLDPFAGSGTTLAVALKHHRHAIGIELNAEYHALAHTRIERTQPRLFEVML